MVNVLEQVIVFLTQIVAVGATVTVAIESFKPIFLEGISERYGRRNYLAIIYILRFVIAVGIVLSNGVSIFTATAPEIFGRFNESTMLIVVTLLVVFSTEIAKPLLDSLRGLKSGAANTAVSTVSVSDKAVTVTQSTSNVDPIVVEEPNNNG